MACGPAAENAGPEGLGAFEGTAAIRVVTVVGETAHNDLDQHLVEITRRQPQIRMIAFSKVCQPRAGEAVTLQAGPLARRRQTGITLTRFGPRIAEHCAGGEV